MKTETMSISLDEAGHLTAIAVAAIASEIAAEEAVVASALQLIDDPLLFKVKRAVVRPASPMRSPLDQAVDE